VLWYKTTIGGEPVWAENLAALDLMIFWLTGEIPLRPPDPGARAFVEVLPAWMRQRRD
jgi:hypothetical protein